MDAYELILKKRNGSQLSPTEISFLVEHFTAGTISEYQMAALLMAVYFQGMNSRETLALTRSMLASGKILNLSSLKNPCIDKHSTGGVGDKISLILAPLAASCGLIVPMIAGRALGHTGGTLDKLEAIPGFNTQLRIAQFKKQLTSIGVAVIGQTSEMAPADKKIYALRDVTATVESIPLISASIMSKKMAEGITGLVLDVKVGSGAFMKNLASAVHLARTMTSIGKGMGKRIIAVLSDMNQPLGYAIGNTLEIKEAIAILQGRGPQDVRELTLALTGYMLYLGRKAKTPILGKKLAREKLNSGKAYQKFLQLIQAQGGNPGFITNPAKFKQAKYQLPIPALASGYLRKIDTQELGLCATLLGAGRIFLHSKIDYPAGIILKHKLGNRVAKGEPLAILHTNKKSINIISRTQSAFTIGRSKPKIPPLIYRIIRG